jgi:hypothetical protein
MPPNEQRRPGEVRNPQTRSGVAGRPEPTAYLRDDASTAGGPTWYVEARPLPSCHDHDEYAIACPHGDHDALVWRSRPGGDGSGWACPLGHRGALWQLLPGVAQ